MPLPEAMTLNARPVSPPSVQLAFPVLPNTLSSAEVQAWVTTFSEAVKQCESYKLTELQEFVRWALRQSYSSHLRLEERLEFLHLAWKVQKFLWSNPAI
ncbi:MAG TPA: hypothetical protein V6D10_04465 [Trichocoleus sp.]|jgi:hypothetical protein